MDRVGLRSGVGRSKADGAARIRHIARASATSRSRFGRGSPVAFAGVGRSRNRRVTNDSESGRLREVASCFRRGASWFLGAAIVALVVSLGLFGFRAMQVSAQLRVDEIAVEGTARVQDSDIFDYAGVRPGQPIFDLNLDQMTMGLLAHPWIRNVTVRRKLPDSVVILVNEEQPALVVATPAVYVANGDGELFKRVSATDQLDLPLLSGVSASLFESDPIRAKSVVREAISLAEAVNDSADVVGSLQELIWDSAAGWSVATVLPPVRSSLGVGNAELAKRGSEVLFHLGRDAEGRLLSAVDAVFELARRGVVPGEIWADGAGGSDGARRVHVRPASGHLAQL